jgi:hypothetical protein
LDKKYIKFNLKTKTIATKKLKKFMNNKEINLNKKSQPTINSLYLLIIPLDRWQKTFHENNK